ncbi:MAG: right-handed parallel beta-helix repeat-containing protein [Kiritimatiellae bacterium]|nr:right-handed parallel beta-helix repeat-containing protein [Kiritimatiellia bacterium]
MRRPDLNAAAKPIVHDRLTRRAVQFACGLALLATLAAAREYFVLPTGDDANSGASWGEALKSIQAGVKKLEPGDTLTVGPGIYRGRVRVPGLKGTPESTITIRSSRRGGAVLDGFRAVSGFEKVAGTDHTFVAPYAGAVNRLVEQGTGKILCKVAGPQIVEQVVGSFYHDEAGKRLYAHASDSGDPDPHKIQACVGEMGFDVGTGAEHLVIDGFEVRGFDGGGIFLNRPNHATVQDCMVHHCGTAIRMNKAVNSRMLSNQVHSIWIRETSGIAMFWSGTTLDCLAQGNIIRDTEGTALSCYGGDKKIDENFKGTRFIANKVYDCENLGIRYKSGRGEKYGDGTRNVVWGINNGMRCWEGGYNTVGGDPGKHGADTSISFGVFSESPDVDWKFADPAHGDFRLQSDSPARGKGPAGTDLGAHPYEGDVFFVGPQGDDSRAGTSVAAAWRTVGHAARRAGPGHTVYILGGTYNESLAPAAAGTREKPIVFRGRGTEKIVLDGAGRLKAGIELSGKSFVLTENIRVRGFTGAGVAIGGGAEEATVTRCVVHENGGAGIALGPSRAVRLVRNTLWRNAGDGIVVQAGAEGADIVGNLCTENRGAQLNLADAAAGATAYVAFNNLFPGTGGAAVSVTGAPAASVAQLNERVRLGRGNASETPALLDPANGNFNYPLASPCLGRGEHWAPIGAGEYRAEEAELALTALAVHEVTATTATIRWKTPGFMATTRLEWGETPALGRVVDRVHEHMIHHSVTLTGLKPGGTYHCRAHSAYPWLQMHDNPIFVRWDEARPRVRQSSALLPFTTLTAPPPARTLYVHPDGDDEGAGTKEQPWRTLAKAGRAARAGDTVLIEPGTYVDTLVPYNSGVGPDARITFKSAGADPVVIDGRGVMPVGVRILGKAYITLEGFKFLGIRRHDYGGYCWGANYCGVIWLYNADHIEIRKCLISGSSFYTAGIRSNRPTDDKLRELTVEDCAFVMNAWPINIRRQRASVRNCVFPGSYWGNIDVQDPDAEITIRNCLFTSCIEMKLWGHGYMVKAPAGARIDSDYNAIWYQPYDTEYRWVARVMKSEAGPQREYRGGADGLAQWRTDTGNDTHTLIVDTPGFRTEENGGLKVSILEKLSPQRDRTWLPDFALSDDSPCKGKGEGGADMGIRF